MATNWRHALDHNHMRYIITNEDRSLINLFYWNCLFSGYISRRIYKIINVHMLSHKKDYIQAY